MPRHRTPTERLRRALARLHLEGVARGTALGALRFARWVGGTDRALVRRHFESEPARRLHLGCGTHLLDGWLNSDRCPRSGRLLSLDVTRRFPLPDDAFDYVFSEHVIEHLEYRQGGHMLAECFRVLKPGGRLRISTPDLAFLLALHGDDLSDLQEGFIRHSIDTWFKGAPGYDSTFVINNYVRAWGHQFIYDERVLRDSMERAGFTHLKRYPVSESEDEELRNLEHVSRKPPGLIALESCVIEGTKP